MLLILSIYSEENLIDDEGTIIQTLTFTLGVAMQKRDGGGGGNKGEVHFSSNIFNSVYFPTAI